MTTIETAALIAQRRWITAEALFSGMADLNGYPFQLLGVFSNARYHAENYTAVMAAAEMLMPYGWELVTLSNYANANSHPQANAVLRRRQPG